MNFVPLSLAYAAGNPCSLVLRRQPQQPARSLLPPAANSPARALRVLTPRSSERNCGACRNSSIVAHAGLSLRSLLQVHSAPLGGSHSRAGEDC
jgi:hypothetical protein